MIVQGPRSIGALSPFDNVLGHRPPIPSLPLKGSVDLLSHIIEKNAKYAKYGPGSKAGGKENGKEIGIRINLGHFEVQPGLRHSIKDVLNRERAIFIDPEPTVDIQKDVQDGVVIKLTAWCKKENYWEVMGDLMKAVKMYLFSNGISYTRVMSI